MLSVDAKFVQCDHQGCQQQVANHRWGKIKAEHWFFGRDNHQAFCPEHLPEWVVPWRETKRAQGAPHII